MKKTKLEEIIKDAEITLRTDYEDDRPDTFLVDLSKIGHVIEVEAKDKKDARAKALETVIDMDPALRRFDIEE